jgi:polyhydroxybutyrate depolymerase
MAVSNRRSFVGVVVAVSVAVVAAAALGSAQEPARAPALVSQSWTVNGVERTALVAAPAELPPPTTPVPLVFVFHGHGGTSAQASRSFRIHDAWPNAVVIYPQGLPTSGKILDFLGERPGWQHLAGTEGDRDLLFVDTMLMWVKMKYTIHPAHTFAAGHSNGGSMVYVLWSARPDVFAAFAPSSSVFPAAVVGTATPKPVFIVIGREDALVPFKLQDFSLKGVLRINQVDTDSKPWSPNGNDRAEKDTRRHPPAKEGRGAEVVTYIHDGGHPLPENAGALMVKFFKTINDARK